MKFHIEIKHTSRYCYINAINSNNERIGKVCIDLDSEDINRYKVNNKQTAKIILIWTSESYCGKGVATALMNKIIELLNDYVLYLNVVPLRNNINKNDLIKFYSKFGFKRYDKDICITTMIKK